MTTTTAVDVNEAVNTVPVVWCPHRAAGNRWYAAYSSDGATFRYDGIGYAPYLITRVDAQSEWDGTARDYTATRRGSGNWAVVEVATTEREWTNRVRSDQPLAGQVKAAPGTTPVYHQTLKAAEAAVEPLIQAWAAKRGPQLEAERAAAEQADAELSERYSYRTRLLLNGWALSNPDLERNGFTLSFDLDGFRSDGTLYVEVEHEQFGLNRCATITLRHPVTNGDWGAARIAQFPVELGWSSTRGDCQLARQHAFAVGNLARLGEQLEQALRADNAAAVKAGVSK